MRQLPLGVQLRVSSRFASFQSGVNAAAVNELVQFAAGAGPAALWLWGPAGSGKSHLLQAACAAAAAAGLRTAYVPLPAWIAVGPGVLAGYDELDLVCLDDLADAAGRAEWERAIFNLYNGLHERAGRLVIASHEPPAQSGIALPDLASRMAAASVHHLRPLPEDAHATALVARAAAQGLDLPDDTLQYLLRRAPRDFAALCRLLDALDAAALAARRRLTVPLARAVLEQD